MFSIYSLPIVLTSLAIFTAFVFREQTTYGVGSRWNTADYQFTAIALLYFAAPAWVVTFYVSWIVPTVVLMLSVTIPVLLVKAKLMKDNLVFGVMLGLGSGATVLAFFAWLFRAYVATP